MCCARSWVTSASHRHTTYAGTTPPGGCYSRSCEMGEARNVIARLDGCTARAVAGHGILVAGEAVSIVRPRALKAVYTGPIHKLEVRDGGGGNAGLRKRLDKMSDQMRDVERQAEEQRAEAARMAEATEIMAADLRAQRINTAHAHVRAQQAAEQLGAQAEEARRRLGELGGAAQASAARATVAEKLAEEQAALAARRHEESQAAQEQLMELNRQMARFMADCTAGRDPMVKFQGEQLG